ncbi:unnamed protein product [Ranitomeya imitator]|uniref:Uncharacterized protein n=1 Tax=Ranitomeya imitator TaxID=111125 RepID=A0ABN9KWZ1_9NEOB|nr:unnamed protein product [Ranitomeya imitator]
MDNIKKEITEYWQFNEDSADKRKLSLTLEEKQRLAKEQEQVQKMKSQKPLTPSTMTPAAPVKQTKDLTMTLMENMSSLNSFTSVGTKPAVAGFPPVTGMPGSVGFPGSVDNMASNRNLQNGLNSNTGFQAPGFSMGPMNPNHNFFSGTAPMGLNKVPPMSTPATMQNYNTISSPPGMQQQNSFSKPASDMSSLDSLFGPQKPKVSMSQMSQQKQNPWINQYVPPQASQTMIGNAWESISRCYSVIDILHYATVIQKLLRVIDLDRLLDSET